MYVNVVQIHTSVHFQTVLFHFLLGQVPVGKEAEWNLYTLPAALERMKFSIFSMCDSFRD